MESFRAIIIYTLKFMYNSPSYKLRLTLFYYDFPPFNYFF